jgi:uncharacterized membrane-anchored protein YitT (DUF2179 family)
MSQEFVSFYICLIFDNMYLLAISYLRMGCAFVSMLIVGHVLSFEIQTLLVAACISLPTKKKLMTFVCQVSRKKVKLEFILKLNSESNLTVIYLFGSIRY